MKIKALLREQEKIGKDGYRTRVERAPDGIDLIEEPDEIETDDDIRDPEDFDHLYGLSGEEDETTDE